MFQALFGNKDHNSNKGSKKSNVAGTGTSNNDDDASKLIHRSTNNPNKSSLSSSFNASVLEMVKEHNDMLAQFLAGKINADIYREQLKRILQSSQNVSWYDNECGYSNRVLDLIKQMEKSS